MKKFADVERTRRAYHSAPGRNSVHRSAAIFPILDTGRYQTNLTFLNHWLIKRGIPEIGARHTLSDAEGARLAQVYTVLDQPKAYAVDLEEIAEAAALQSLPREGTWEVEFFSARNLFIPYPAVVMNSSNDHFFNQVHAYARTLSDVDEDAQINATDVREASLDVVVDEDHDTFVEVLNGPHAADAEVAFTLQDQDGRAVERSRRFAGGPYAKRRYLLSEVFGEAVAGTRADRTLFMRQPHLDMFFSRVCGGVIPRDGGAFTANHSYYDNGRTGEYWTIDPAHEAHSSKNFPLFDDLGLVLRLYPIQCPAALDFHVALYDGSGRRAGTVRDVAFIEEGSHRILEFDLGAIGRQAGACSAELFLTPRGGDRVPMRVAVQVCYGTGSGLDSSIKISLFSPYVFAPEGKPGRAWVEIAGAPEVENRLGLYHTSPLPDTAEHEVTIHLYRDADTQTRSATLRLHGKQAWAHEMDALIPGYKDFLGGRNGFIYGESDSQFLRCLSLQTHGRTGHTSGEHGF